MGATTIGGEIMMHPPRRRVTRLLILGLAISSIANLGPLPQQRTVPRCLARISQWIEAWQLQVVLQPVPRNRRWVKPPRSDGFRLVGAPASVYVRSERADGITTRSLCAAGDATWSMFLVPFEYRFIGSDRWGTGHLTVTVTPRLAVTASAQPQRINLGEASQLAAQVSRGVPPYSYLWIPSSGLNATNIPTPLASPAVTTTYTVHITDSAGEINEASVRSC